MGFRRLKILVFLDHPIIVRHFLAAGAFAELEARHDVLYVALPPDHKRIKGADLSTIAPHRVIRLPEATNRSSIWNRLFQIESLRTKGDPQARALARHHAFAIGAWTARKYRWLGAPGVWPIYRRYLTARVTAIPNLPMQALFDAERPDAIVHPTVLAGAYLNDLVAICRTREIPLIAVMNSWDNPSTKRAMVGHPDWLLVWGPQTREHALTFGQMPADRVVEFGASQFDVYSRPPRIDRVGFCARHGIDPDGDVLLYAGSSKGCDEYADLDALEQAVEDGSIPGTKIVYRPHPWGDCGKDGGRIAARIWRHVVFESTMSDYVRRAGSGPQGITTPDYADTRDLLANVDATISPLSTILLESALCGKPSLCVIDDADARNWFLAVSFDMLHFKEFFACGEFDVAKGRSDLIAGAARVLARARDPDTASRLRKATERFVARFDAPFDRRFADFVEAKATR